MPQENPAAEAEIRTACTNAGVLTAAIEDFVEDFRAYKFSRDKIAKWIDECRQTRPHRFAAQGSDDAQLFAAAFGPNSNMTKRSEVVRKFGVERAAEIAAMFGTTLGGKGGAVPDNLRPKEPEGGGSRNPWHPSNCDPRSGRYTANALTRQGDLVRAIGVERASQIASIYAHIGATRPRAA